MHTHHSYETKKNIARMQAQLIATRTNVLTLDRQITALINQYVATTT